MASEGVKDQQIKSVKSVEELTAKTPLGRGWTLWIKSPAEKNKGPANNDGWKGNLTKAHTFDSVRKI